MSTEGFSYDSIFVRMLNRIGDVFILSIAFVLFSLPIFTIGASLTALYYTSMKSIKGDDGYIWKNFVKSFKLNFKQSTVMWLGFLLVFFVLGVDVWFWYQQKKAGENKIFDVLLIGSAVMFLLAFIIFLYAFPLQAKFENKIGIQIRNAFILSIRYFPTTLLLLLISLVILWAFYYQPALMVAGFLLFGFGIVGHLYGYFMLRCFKPYLATEPVDRGDEWHLELEDEGAEEEKVEEEEPEDEPDEVEDDETEEEPGEEEPEDEEPEDERSGEVEESEKNKSEKNTNSDSIKDSQDKKVSENVKKNKNTNKNTKKKKKK